MLLITRTETSRCVVTQTDADDLAERFGDDHPELVGIQLAQLQEFLTRDFDRGGQVAEWIAENWLAGSDLYTSETTITTRN
jgi:hypothetical protein